MGPLGFPELIFILALALLIFGPRKLPEIGRTIGKAMGEFRRATTDLKRSFDTELAAEDPAQKAFKPGPASAPESSGIEGPPKPARPPAAAAAPEAAGTPEASADAPEADAAAPTDSAGEAEASEGASPSETAEPSKSGPGA